MASPNHFWIHGESEKDKGRKLQGGSEHYICAVIPDNPEAHRLVAGVDTKGMCCVISPKVQQVCLPSAPHCTQLNLRPSDTEI